MYKFYNPHPNGSHTVTDDCVKRALTVTTGMDYMDVQRELNRYKKISGAKRFNSAGNPDNYVKNILGSKRIPCPQKITAREFCTEHPSGRYILDMKGHWSSLVDGIIYDTWDVSEETVLAFYKIALAVQDERTYRNCCTTEVISASEARVIIHYSTGLYTRRIVPINLLEGYIRCIEDEGYPYVKF